METEKKRPARRTQLLTVLVNHAEKAELEALEKRTGESRSALIRRLVREAARS